VYEKKNVCIYVLCHLRDDELLEKKIIRKNNI